MTFWLVPFWPEEKAQCHKLCTPLHVLNKVSFFLIFAPLLHWKSLVLARKSEGHVLQGPQRGPERALHVGLGGTLTRILPPHSASMRFPVYSAPGTVKYLRKGSAWATEAAAQSQHGRLGATKSLSVMAGGGSKQGGGQAWCPLARGTRRSGIRSVHPRRGTWIPGPARDCLEGKENTQEGRAGPESRVEAMTPSPSKASAETRNHPTG